MGKRIRSLLSMILVTAMVLTSNVSAVFAADMIVDEESVIAVENVIEETATEVGPSEAEIVKDELIEESELSEEVEVSDDITLFEELEGSYIKTWDSWDQDEEQRHSGYATLAYKNGENESDGYILTIVGNKDTMFQPESGYNPLGVERYPWYEYASEIVEVYVEGTIKEIPYGMFKLYSNLKKVTLNEGLDRIADNAFNGCSSIEGIFDIPYTVTSIGSNAFLYCDKITGFSGGENIAAFKNDNGDLIEKEVFNTDTINVEKVDFVKTTLDTNASAVLKSYDWYSDNRDIDEDVSGDTEIDLTLEEHNSGTGTIITKSFASFDSMWKYLDAFQNHNDINGCYTTTYEPRVYIRKLPAGTYEIVQKACFNVYNAICYTVDESVTDVNITYTFSGGAQYKAAVLLDMSSDGANKTYLPIVDLKSDETYARVSISGGKAKVIAKEQLRDIEGQWQGIQNKEPKEINIYNDACIVVDSDIYLSDLIVSDSDYIVPHINSQGTIELNKKKDGTRPVINVYYTISSYSWDSKLTIVDNTISKTDDKDSYLNTPIVQGAHDLVLDTVIYKTDINDLLLKSIKKDDKTYSIVRTEDIGITKVAFKNKSYNDKVFTVKNGYILDMAYIANNIEGYYSDGSKPMLAFPVDIESCDEDIATVNNEDKTVITKDGANGIANIKFYPHKNKDCYVSVKVNVLGDVKNVTLDSKEKTVNANSSTTLRATVEPSNNVDNNIQWVVKDSSNTILSTPSGIYVTKQTKSGGSTTAQIKINPELINGQTSTYTVIARSMSNYKDGYFKKETPADSDFIQDVCSITVKAKYALDKYEINDLGRGEKAVIGVKDTDTDKSVTAKSWLSSDTNVATVSGGTVYALGIGKAEISATLPDGSVQKCTVNVVDKLNAVTISKENAKMVAGDSDTLNISFSPVDYANEYKDKVVVISGNGVTAEKDYTNIEKGIIKVLVNAKDDIVFGDDDSIESVVTVKYPTKDAPASDDDYKTLECKYTIYRKDEYATPSDIKTYAITNITPKLSDIQYQLDEIADKKSNGGTGDKYGKWEWVNPSTTLVATAGQDLRNYQVKHTSPDGTVIYSNVPVYIATVTGVDNSFLPKSIEVGDDIALPDDDAKDAGIITTGCDFSTLKSISANGISREYAYTSSAEDIIGTNPLKGKAVGTSNITVKLEIKVKDTTKTISAKAAAVKVVSDIANVSTEFYTDVPEEKISETDGYYKLVAGHDYKIMDTTPRTGENPYVIKYASSDTSVAKVIVKEGVSYIQPIDYGVAVITATSNDAVKSSAAYTIKVEDYNKLLLTDAAFTFNKAVTEDNRVASTRIITGFDSPAYVVGLYSDAECGPETRVDTYGTIVNGDILTLSLSDAKLSAAKSETLYLNVRSTAPSVSNTFKIKVNVVSTQPKITVKQTRKADLLYNYDSYSGAASAADLKDISNPYTGIINVAAPGYEIEKVTVSGNGIKNKGEFGYIAPSDITGDNSVNIPVALKDSANKDNKNAVVIVKLAGYGEIKKEIAIAGNGYTMALSATTGTLYPAANIKTVDTAVYNKTAKVNETLSGATVLITGERKVKNAFPIDLSSIYAASINSDGGITVSLKADQTPVNGDAIMLKVKNGNWMSEYSLKYTVKVSTVDKAKLALQKSTVNMYVYPDSSMNNGVVYTDGLTITGGNNANALLSSVIITEDMKNYDYPTMNNKINVNYIPSDGLIKLSYNGYNTPTPGKTYKYLITLPKSVTGATKDVTTTLSVKVAAVDTANCVTVSGKGTIDPLNRAGTSVTVTPKFKNVPVGYTVKGVTLKGIDANLFEIGAPNPVSGVATITLKPGVQVATKHAYKVTPEYTVDIGENEVKYSPAKDLSITLKHGKTSVKMVKAVNVFKSGKAQTDEIEILTLNSSNVSLDADRIALQNPNKDFELKYEDGKYKLEYNALGAVKKGKTYTLKFNVYPNGMAINEKPITLSYKVKVSK